MILNERKIKILEAIINDYVSTAEPIGSRTIAKKYDLGISSATIRNEMSDLEEMGLIVQPHASSGRVPSDKGYRLYVDKFMSQKELSEEQMLFLHNMISNNINQIDYLIQETAKAISLLTHYTTIVTEPQAKKTILKHLQLIPLDESNLLLVLVTDGKIVRNHNIHLKNVPDIDILNRLSNILNSYLQGHSLEEIDIRVVTKLKTELSEYGELLGEVLSAVVEIIQSIDNVQVFLSGTKNLLGFPEFSDVEKAKGIFQTLEEKEMLITLLGNSTDEDVQIIIGNENDMEQMKDCSVIKTNYKLGDQVYGSIGIIGPTRMDYSQVVSVLRGLVKNIDVVLKALAKSDGNSS